MAWGCCGAQVGGHHEGLLQGLGVVPLEVGPAFRDIQEGAGRETLKEEGEESVFEMLGEVKIQPRTVSRPPSPSSWTLWHSLYTADSTHYCSLHGPVQPQV